jgi:hypothetical protein
MPPAHCVKLRPKMSRALCLVRPTLRATPNAQAVCRRRPSQPHYQDASGQSTRGERCDMRMIALVAAVSGIALVLGSAAHARGFGGGFHAGGFNGGGSHWGGSHWSGSHWGGSHWGGSHWAGHASSTHSFGTSRSGSRQSAAATGNVRSNRGGLRRGQERAAYVHQLNNQRHQGQSTGAGTRTASASSAAGAGRSGASTHTAGTTSHTGATSGSTTGGVTRIGSNNGVRTDRDGDRD